MTLPQLLSTLKFVRAVCFAPEGGCSVGGRRGAGGFYTPLLRPAEDRVAGELGPVAPTEGMMGGSRDSGARLLGVMRVCKSIDSSCCFPSNLKKGQEAGSTWIGDVSFKGSAHAVPWHAPTRQVQSEHKAQPIQTGRSEP